MVTLQERIYDYLTSLIRRGQPHGKLPSHSEIQEHFKVSAVTVRSVIKKLESSGHIYCRQGKGCFIRKIPQDVENVRLFLILPASARISSEFVIGVWEIARKRRYHMMFFNYNGDDNILAQEIRSFVPNVIIWIAPNTLTCSSSIERLTNLGAYLLLFNRAYDHSSVSYICSDFRRDGGEMARLTVASGGKNVLYVGHDQMIDYSALRYSGFVESLPSDCELTTLAFSLSDYTPGSLKKSLELKLRIQQYDVIICSQEALWQDISGALALVGCDTTRVIFGCFDKIPDSDPLFEQTTCLVQPVREMSVTLMQGVRDLLEQKTMCVRKVVHSLPLSKSPEKQEKNIIC